MKSLYGKNSLSSSTEGPVAFYSDDWLLEKVYYPTFWQLLDITFWVDINTWNPNHHYNTLIREGSG